MPRLSSLWRHQSSRPNVPVATPSRADSRSLGATQPPEQPAPALRVSRPAEPPASVPSPMTPHLTAPAGVDRAEANPTAPGGKPARKRCLNEGAHKLAD